MTQVEKGAVKADLYEAVNGEWEQDRPNSGRPSGDRGL